MPDDGAVDGSRLPPKQRTIKSILRWGKDHPPVAFVPKIDPRDWSLRVEGEVENPLSLNWDLFQGLPKAECRRDFHCVEGWSVLDCRWEGVRFREIVSLAKPLEGAIFVLFECADGYTTSLSIEELLGDDALLAYKLNGKALESDLGGPVRLVVPSKYAYKSAMWITKISFSSKKELGYWERRGYSDTADVWKDDRYSF